APQQPFQAGHQHGRVLARHGDRLGPAGVVAGGRGVGPGIGLGACPGGGARSGIGGGRGAVGGGHVVTKWTTTAMAKVMVAAMARLNAMMMPMPSALMATEAELRPRCQSFWRIASETYRPITKPMGRPRKGITKMPTTPEASPTRIGHIGTSCRCRRRPVRT